MTLVYELNTMRLLRVTLGKKVIYSYLYGNFVALGTIADFLKACDMGGEI